MPGRWSMRFQGAAIQMSTNRDKVLFVHVPRTGGTFVLNVLFDTRSLHAEHKKLDTSGVGTKRILSCVRNPIDWYGSLFNFFKYPRRQIGNRFQRIVGLYEDIDLFTADLLERSLPRRGLELAPMDSYYFSHQNGFGLLTNYLLHFFDFAGEHVEDEITDFVRNLPSRCVFLRQENLREELLAFSEENDLSLERNLLDRRINESTKRQHLDEETVRLIETRERPVFDVFYPTRSCRSRSPPQRLRNSAGDGALAANRSSASPIPRSFRSPP